MLTLNLFQGETIYTLLLGGSTITGGAAVGDGVSSVTTVTGGGEVTLAASSLLVGEVVAGSGMSSDVSWMVAPLERVPVPPFGALTLSFISIFPLSFSTGGNDVPDSSWREEVTERESKYSV